MNRSAYNRPTRLFVGLVVVGGVVAGADLLRTWSGIATDDIAALAVFTALGLAWNLMTFYVDRGRAGRAAISLAPASFQALVALTPGPAAATCAVLVCVSDWVAHRRKLMPGLFNVGQTLIGVWAASRVASAVVGEIAGVPGIATAGLAGAAVISFSSVGLTQMAIRMAHGRGVRDSGVVAYSALTNEAVLCCFSAMMATAWTAHPLMIAIPVVPLTILFVLLGRLERRESDLSKRQKELQAIQELGLEVSAQLDVQHLGPVVTRIVAEDLRARGAFLALADGDAPHFDVAAFLDRYAQGGDVAPTRLPRDAFSAEFLARGVPRIAQQAAATAIPGCGALPIKSLIAQPVSILGRPEAVIVVFDDGRREPFGNEDAARLGALTRFIEVALNNARLYDNLREMQAQVVQSEKLSALGQLVSGVAHELNNPLATIIGSAELCASHALPANTHQTVQRIRKEAERAARIVRNLLTFSRRHKPETGWHSVQQIVAEVRELRAPECATHRIDLIVDIAADLPPVQVDPHQIHQVLLNLVTNAEQAIAGAQRSGAITIRATHEGRRVRIEVGDDGPGIPEDNLGKIFNPFFTTKPVGKGTGLGLSICYGIVQEHGGTIRVRSFPGRGTTFTIELPEPTAPYPPEMLPGARSGSLAGAGLAVAAAPGGEPTAAAPTPAAAGPVLVVDDEDGVRTVLVEALEAWGFEVVAAASGEQGLSFLRSRRFGLAIIDLRMPGLDGPGLFERARESAVPMPPVIFSTGDAASADARAFLEASAAPVLLKPFTLLTLRETVDAALAARKPVAVP